MNTIQTDYETMLMTGTKTAFKFAKPYFLNTFEWYTKEEYNELCNLIHKNIDDIMALPFLTIANQRKLEVLECMLEYVKLNDVIQDNVETNINKEPKTQKTKPSCKCKQTNETILNIIEECQQQINDLQDKLHTISEILEGDDCQCKSKD